MAGEACLHLEELQQQGKAQTGGTGLVGHQQPVGIDQRPTGHQVFWFPVPPHRAAVPLSSAPDVLLGPPDGNGSFLRPEAWTRG